MSAFDNIVSEWIDLSIDATKNEYTSKIEPFEIYKEKVKMKGLRAFNDYLNSIENGYHVILERIERELK